MVYYPKQDYYDSLPPYTYKTKYFSMAIGTCAVITQPLPHSGPPGFQCCTQKSWEPAPGDKAIITKITEAF